MISAKLPSLVLGATIAAYWSCVGLMVLRVRRSTHSTTDVLIPKLKKERLMWLIWVPLIVAWIDVPIRVGLGLWPDNPLFIMPEFAHAGTAANLIRLAAAAVGVVFLLLSIRCWRFMGDNWRMAVDPNQKSPLLIEGPFSRVRHPIYALSIGLMMCSVIAVPVPGMLAISAVHITMMNIKARNEERFLKEKHGSAYQDYCSRTGRFLPPIRRVAS